MATDVEESDTDDHERPAPPKRQCTRLVVDGNDSYDNLNSTTQRQLDGRTSDAEESEYDDVEKLAREKLSLWQARQVAKGFLDNTINCAMENCILNMPATYLGDDPQMRLFRGADMEDTAVTMAIRNHGLVSSADAVSQTRMMGSNGIFGRCSGDDVPQLLRICSSNRLSNSGESSTSSLPCSSTTFDATDSREFDDGVTTAWPEDEKMDETDREQDFLERAVAEAIKKKGLSALSVDYG